MREQRKPSPRLAATQFVDGARALARFNALIALNSEAA
jgi:hypothetical protein